MILGIETMKQIRRIIRGNHLLLSLARWFDEHAGKEELESIAAERIDWFRILPFVLLHLSCLAVIWVGWSWTAIGTAIGLYAIRMFAITAGYHRYFSHSTYRTSRAFQFILAVLGVSSAQRGPLWWAAHHRNHHRCTEQKEDIHSPIQHGFWWSHMGWFTTPQSFPTQFGLVRNLSKYPELRFLNRFSTLVPLILLLLLIVAGELVRMYIPSAGTNGLQMAVWGFSISTVVLFHATARINSLDHLIGRRRYATPDNSRNNWFLAILTFGEGWHNNHHHYPATVRQGFFWWEYDLTYYVLAALSWLGIVQDLRPIPKEIRAKNLIQS